MNDYLKWLSQHMGSSGNSSWRWPRSHQLAVLMGGWSRGNTEGSPRLAGQSHPLEVTLAPWAFLVLERGGIKYQGSFGDGEEEKSSFFLFPDSKWGLPLASSSMTFSHDLSCLIWLLIFRALFCWSWGNRSSFRALKMIAVFATCPWLLSKGKSAFLSPQGRTW